MPGIVGIIGRGPHSENSSTIQKMADCLVHESFYRSGTWGNEQLGVWAGWACFENSYADCLPVWNETRDVCLIFSGDHYSEGAESERLKAAGHQFSPGNASFLVHLYEEQGPKFVEQINGWFSGVLIDLRREVVILFNDRYALNRIYYHQNDCGFYFASEAKALLRVLPHLRKLDQASFAEVFSCGCALQNRTLFSGVAQLPGAARWTFPRGGAPRKEHYFKPETWENQSALAAADYHEELQATFSRVVGRYVRGRERVGMSLTGGFDGRIVMAWAKAPPGGLPCYTFGGIYRECADLRLGRRIAHACGQSHQVIPAGDDFFAEYPRLVERSVYLSDGTMDASGAVELHVNRLARQIAPVRLTGNYGGEIMRRLVTFSPRIVNPALFTPEFIQAQEGAAATYAAERNCPTLSFIAFKQVPWHHYSRLSLERSQVGMRSPYLDNELVSLAFRAPPELAVGTETAFRLVAAGNPRLTEFPTDRGLAWHPVPVISRLANAIHEFSFKAEYAYDYGMPQSWVKIDHLLKAFRLERLFLGRHKFYHYRVYYRDRFAKYLREVLLDPRTCSRPYLRRGRLEQMVEAHLGGTGNYTLEIHKILTAELIQRLFIEAA